MKKIKLKKSIIRSPLNNKTELMRFNILLIVGAIALILLIGCTLSKNQNDSELIHINLRGPFPEREIRLEEIADIEFLQLETHVDYLFRGFPQIITTDKIIFLV